MCLYENNSVMGTAPLVCYSQSVKGGLALHFLSWEVVKTTKVHEVQPIPPQATCTNVYVVEYCLGH